MTCSTSSRRLSHNGERREDDDLDGRDDEDDELKSDHSLRHSATTPWKL